jgi:hypothetical protein
LATVITNLFSAVPVFGQDLVELIFTTNLNGCFGNEIVDFTHYAIEGYANYATVLSVLPTVGTVSVHALKKGKNITSRFDKKDYLSIPYKFIAFLVGLIDGDGYIQITKSTKGYIAIRLVICLSLEDISTLEYIHSVLKLGKITIYRDIKNPICKLVINKTDLQEIFFPLLIHHNIFFLTKTRRAQFDLAMFILKNNIKFYDQIANMATPEGWSNIGIPSIFKLPETAQDYINLAFFKDWLVGFTNAEGSFCIKNNKDGCYQLKQRIHVQLFGAFQVFFNTKRSIYIENDMYAQFSVSSKTDIQTVINFFSFSGCHPLIGLKSIQYFKWLTDLQNSYRYRNLNFPE